MTLLRQTQVATWTLLAAAVVILGGIIAFGADPLRWFGLLVVLGCALLNALRWRRLRR